VRRCCSEAGNAAGAAINLDLVLFSDTQLPKFCIVVIWRLLFMFVNIGGSRKNLRPFLKKLSASGIHRRGACHDQQLRRQ
jgi:hypothetical protein